MTTIREYVATLTPEACRAIHREIGDTEFGFATIAPPITTDHMRRAGWLGRRSIVVLVLEVYRRFALSHGSIEGGADAE